MTNIYILKKRLNDLRKLYKKARSEQDKYNSDKFKKAINDIKYNIFKLREEKRKRKK
jgi:hypothetical protein